MFLNSNKGKFKKKHAKKKPTKKKTRKQKTKKKKKGRKSINNPGSQSSGIEYVPDKTSELSEMEFS